MERVNYPSYHSTSVLGEIYDEVKRQESETVSPISKLWTILTSSLTLEMTVVGKICIYQFYLSEISPLKCFTEEVVAEGYKSRWRHLYQQEYLKESAPLCKVDDKKIKNIKFRALYQKYKWVSISILAEMEP